MNAKPLTSDDKNQAARLATLSILDGNLIMAHWWAEEYVAHSQADRASTVTGREPQ